MLNRVKQKLKHGRPALGVNLSVMDPLSIEVVGNSGFDWVLYDTEHGPWSIEAVDDMIRQTCGCSASPIIRVVWDDLNAIKRALDTGAYGVIVPWVSTRKMAEDAVRFCRYPPEGLRGCGPGRAARAWGVSVDEYIEVANREILVAVQIERAEAVSRVEEIVSVEGVDATWIGPADLSLSMGVKVRDAFSDPRVSEAMDAVVDACVDAGVAPGIAAGGGVEQINRLIERGFRFITVGGDLGMLDLGCATFLRGIREP